MDGCSLVRLSGLMRRTEGVPQVAIGLIDGPVAAGHPGLAAGRVVPAGGRDAGCRCPASPPCLHGTFIAGILAGRRGGTAPAICPGCTLLVRPVFADCAADAGATPAAVAQGIHECIDAGARILNLSAALSAPRVTEQPALTHALDRACRRGVLVVAAAGNDPTVAATALTGHHWVLPVSAYGAHGTPLRSATVGRSIGSRGLGAPGQGITSVTPGGATLTLDGTSFAAPFVTGTAALLWSLYPQASAGHLKRALLGVRRRTSVVPPMLDAEGACHALERSVPHVRSAS